MSYASDQGVLNAQYNAAIMAQRAEEERVRPFYLLRPPVFPDGNAWCALYGENLQEGVAGFGATPAEAAADFDQNWRNMTLARRGGRSRELAVEIAQDGIGDRMDIDTGAREWAEGAVDALIAGGLLRAGQIPPEAGDAD